jgi:hypothetical protein
VINEAITLGDAHWKAGMVAAFHLLSRAPLPASQSHLASSRLMLDGARCKAQDVPNPGSL